MAFKENLFSNFLTFFILFALAVIIYCKVKKQTLMEIIKEYKEIKDE